MKGERHSRVVLLSGGTGVGKDYASLAVRDTLGLKDVSQVTTRKHRGPGNENKQPISKNEYAQYLNRRELIGHHIENSAEEGKISYGYVLKQVKEGVPTILEINPVTAIHLLDELKENGIDVAGWLGLYANDEYLIANIKLRQDMTPAELENRLKLSHAFTDVIFKRHKQGVLTHPMEIGSHNRATMAADITQLVKDLLRL